MEPTHLNPTFQAISSAADFKAPPHPGPYAYVVSNEAHHQVPTQELYQLAEALIRAGAVHVACGGIDAERWHDVCDDVCVMAEIEGKKAQHVTTTWHVGESLEEVAAFVTNSALSVFKCIYVLRWTASEPASR